MKEYSPQTASFTAWGKRWETKSFQPGEDNSFFIWNLENFWTNILHQLCTVTRTKQDHNIISKAWNTFSLGYITMLICPVDGFALVMIMTRVYFVNAFYDYEQSVLCETVSWLWPECTWWTHVMIMTRVYFVNPCHDYDQSVLGEPLSWLWPESALWIGVMIMTRVYFVNFVMTMTRMYFENPCHDYDQSVFCEPVSWLWPEFTLWTLSLLENWHC